MKFIIRVQSVGFDQGFRHGRVKNLSLSRRANINSYFLLNYRGNHHQDELPLRTYAVTELVLMLGLVTSKLGNERYN